MQASARGLEYRTPRSLRSLLTGFDAQEISTKKAHQMVTLLGENWNTFWQELERFDTGFQDLLPEEDC
jgi:hypothetical protein